MLRGHIFERSRADVLCAERMTIFKRIAEARRKTPAEAMIHNEKECDREISMANGESLKIPSVGRFRLRVIGDGKERAITLSGVYLAPKLARNITSYEKLEQRRFGLVYRRSSLSLVRRSDVAIANDVSMQTNVLYV